MRLLYSFFIQLYTFSIGLFAVLNEKAKLWIMGRKNWKQNLNAINFKDYPVFWFHCASLGEFEQGRPLIEEIKASGQYKILLTFFSPSGYELRKNYQHADWVFYLPADTIGNAHYFLEKVQPKAVFFIKYEFWFNYLNELKKRQVPTFLIAGIFRANQHFFKWYGSWAAKQLQAFDYFFVQNQTSLELLQTLGYKNAIIAGDTRFDRVLQIYAQRKSNTFIDSFVQDALICVAGSTYLEDEKLLRISLQHCIAQGINVKMIIAPHVIANQRILEIENLFGEKECIRFSQLNKAVTNKRILIIDNIGMLSSLYAYAQIAYIGGGLGKGIHNTLEAAVYGIPLLFGNNYQKFDEAKALVESGAALVIQNEMELNKHLSSLFDDANLRLSMGNKSSNYVQDQKGALLKIINELKSKNIFK